MRIVLTLTLVALLGIISTSCSRETKQQLPTSSSATPLPEAPAEEGIPTMPYDEMLREVSRLSKEAGIVNLKDANLADGQTEIRIWKAFGILYPRCFILSLTNGIPTASLVGPKLTRTKIKKGERVYARTTLNAPRSGWDNFLSYLKEHGIGSSISLVTDKRYVPDPDGEYLVLEVKSDSLHTMAYFNDSTGSIDGNKAFDVCKQIKKEFDYELGCH